MDWFERLTGFPEAGYDYTLSRLQVEGRNLRSRINDRSYGIGELELVSLRSLREQVATADALPGHLSFRNITGDVRRLHQVSENAGALFQVASQFNLLEMVSPDVRPPEQGVTRYQHDRTQGPACAIASGAATIYRNYFAPVGDGFGQRGERQLDGLADVGAALGHALGKPVADLWTMRNGYALCSQEGLAAIGAYLRAGTAAEIDALRALLRVGVHQDVEVTDVEGPHRQIVSQVFCSALPVAYTNVPTEQWQPFAELVLGAKGVGAGDALQLEVPQATRRGDVGAPAQVHERRRVAVDADRVAGADLAGVERVVARRARSMISRLYGWSANTSRASSGVTSERSNAWSAATMSRIRASMAARSSSLNVRPSGSSKS